MPRNPRPDQIGMGGRITPEYALSGSISISIPISGSEATSTLILDAKRSGESAMVVSNDVARSRTVSPLKNALKLSTYAAVSEIGRPIR